MRVWPPPTSQHGGVRELWVADFKSASRLHLPEKEHKERNTKNKENGETPADATPESRVRLCGGDSVGV